MSTCGPRAEPNPNRQRSFSTSGPSGPSIPAFVSVEQFMIALMVRWARYGAGPNWSPSEVKLRSDSVPRTSIRTLAGDAQVRTRQQVTSIVFPSRQFVGPIEAFPEKGSPVWQRHRRDLERSNDLEDLAGSLRLVLPAYLPDGSPSIEKGANLAGTSVRTLQRRLREQGLSYSELLEGSASRSGALPAARSPAIRSRNQSGAGIPRSRDLHARLSPLDGRDTQRVPAHAFRLLE